MDLAIEALVRSKRLDARNPYVHLQLGRSLIEAGQADLGVRELERALALKSDLSEVRSEIDRHLTSAE